jgi:sulfate adenylyltransferase subunit 1 (EFTu-like GTPase family)
MDAADEAGALPLRFPVQLVLRAGAGTDFRAYAGRVASGVLARGAEVIALPSGRRTVVKDIFSLDRSLPVAVAGDSVSVVLADDIDLSRGDLLTGPEDPPQVAKALRARVCWLSSEPLDARALAAGRFVLKHTSRSVKARMTSLHSRIEVGTLAEQPAPAGLVMNDIADVGLALAQPIFVDPFRSHRATGSFILIDEVGNQTVAAGMIE